LPCSGFSCQWVFFLKEGKDDGNRKEIDCLLLLKMKKLPPGTMSLGSLYCFLLSMEIVHVFQEKNKEKL